MLIDPGSFRDAAGIVLHDDGRIYRVVTPAGAPEFEQARDSGLLAELAGMGMLIPFSEIDPATIRGRFPGEVAHLLEHPRLEFISYPYEWPFAALKAAALLHLEIQLFALEQGFTLSDATAFNIQFDGSTPVFIDHLSFRRYREGEYWLGHRQFCEQFLNPLLLRAVLGLSHHAWYRSSPAGIPGVELDRILPWYRRFAPLVLLHVTLPAWLQRRRGGGDTRMPPKPLPCPAFRRLLAGLRRGIEKLEAPRDDGTWSEYADRTVYRPDEAATKQAFVRAYVAETMPRMVWDLGCNTGEYAVACLASGARTVVGLDSDPGALDLAFRRARAQGLRLLPLYMDAANPSPSQGWRETERAGLKTRPKPDGIIALAFLHHLVIRHNVPLPDAVDWLIDLAPTGVIEFVPKNDPMVRRLLALRDDIFQNYGQDRFMDCVTRRAEVVDQTILTREGRVLVRYLRRDDANVAG